MTIAEIQALAGLAPITSSQDDQAPIDNKTPEIKGDNVFATFDSLVDAEENVRDDDPVPPKQGVLPQVDHKRYLSTARAQLNCGSCWAFSAALAVESNYNVKYNSNNGQRYPYTSTQELVDCTKNGTYECKGGWMHEAFKTLATLGVISEVNYPYEERLVYCRTAGKPASNLLHSLAYDGCGWNPQFFGRMPCTKESWHKHLTRGPLSVVLKMEDNFARYRSGIIDSSRITECANYDHAVVAYSWKHYVANGVTYEYIELRNSHGVGYGDNGDVRYFYTAGNDSCFITKLGLQPLLN
jgi:hypothetical protein